MRATRCLTTPAARNPPGRKTVQLLAELVNDLEAREPQHPENGEQLLLDMEFNGARYRLLRHAVVRSPSLKISPREIEIARMVAEGHSNKVIAAVLDISSWTVCTHLRRLFAKLGVSSRAAMVARVLEDGLIVSNMENDPLRWLPGESDRDEPEQHLSWQTVDAGWQDCDDDLKR